MDNTDCERCAFASQAQGTCDRCIERGRHEIMGRRLPAKRGLLGLNARLMDAELADGIRTFPSGASYLTRRHSIVEIRAPRRRDESVNSHEARLKRHHEQERAVSEIGADLGFEIAPGMWRLDPDQHVMIFPRAA